MSTTVIGSAIADVQEQLWCAQVAVARAGGVTWTGVAADAAEARRGDLLGTLRRCVQALEEAESLLAAVARAPQAGLAPGLPAGWSRPGGTLGVTW